MVRPSVAPEPGAGASWCVMGQPGTSWQVWCDLAPAAGEQNICPQSTSTPGGEGQGIIPLPSSLASLSQRRHNTAVTVIRLLLSLWSFWPVPCLKASPCAQKSSWQSCSWVCQSKFKNLFECSCTDGKFPVTGILDQTLIWNQHYALWFWNRFSRCHRNI